MRWIDPVNEQQQQRAVHHQNAFTLASGGDQSLLNHACADVHRAQSEVSDSGGAPPPYTISNVSLGIPAARYPAPSRQVYCAAGRAGSVHASTRAVHRCASEWRLIRPCSLRWRAGRRARRARACSKCRATRPPGATLGLLIRGAVMCGAPPVTAGSTAAASRGSGGR